MPGSNDLYEILQVAPMAHPDVINGAYRRLAQLYHPDHSAEPDAETRMAQINHAYSILSDPQKRAEYDQSRAAQRPTAAPAGQPSPPLNLLAECLAQQSMIRRLLSPQDLTENALPNQANEYLAYRYTWNSLTASDQATVEVEKVGKQRQFYNDNYQPAGFTNETITIPHSQQHVTCGHCSGQGQITCPECAGRRLLPCSDCGANGYIVCPPMVVCRRCEGSGQIREQCNACNGNGAIYYAVGAANRCTQCNGAGYLRLQCQSCGPLTLRRHPNAQPEVVSHHGQLICDRCNGQGRRQCGRCKGQTTLQCRKCRAQGFLTCSNCGAQGVLVQTEATQRTFTSHTESKYATDPENANALVSTSRIFSTAGKLPGNTVHDETVEYDQRTGLLRQQSIIDGYHITEQECQYGQKKFCIAKIAGARTERYVADKLPVSARKVAIATAAGFVIIAGIAAAAMLL